MKVIVKRSGLHSSETKEVSRMASELQDSWHAYASALIMDQQGSMEFDLILVIHDRILVVEPKNWRGKLTSYDGNWYIDGKHRSKSLYPSFAVLIFGTVNLCALYLFTVL